MVLIQNDAIPVRCMHPLVLGLDAARAAVPSQIILERPEADERPLLVSLLVGQAAGLDELPAIEVHVAFKSSSQAFWTAGLKVSTSTFFHPIRLAS